MGLGSHSLTGLCGSVFGVLSGWSARSLKTGWASFWWQIDALPGQTQDGMSGVCGDWR